MVCSAPISYKVGARNAQNMPLMNKEIPSVSVQYAATCELK